MRVWIAGLALFLLIPVVAVSATNAAGGKTGTGMVTLTRSEVVRGPIVMNDRTTLVVTKITFSVTGALTGTAVAIEKDLMHNVTKMGRHIISTQLHGLANFTGTLGGMTGTLRISYDGINNSTYIRGHFTLFAGTGQLAGVHGSGPFHSTANMGSTIDYSIRWTVSAHASHAESRDQDRQED